MTAYIDSIDIRFVHIVQIGVFGQSEPGIGIIAINAGIKVIFIDLAPDQGVDIMVPKVMVIRKGICPSGIAAHILALGGGIHSISIKSSKGISGGPGSAMAEPGIYTVGRPEFKALYRFEFGIYVSYYGIPLVSKIGIVVPIEHYRQGIGLPSGQAVQSRRKTELIRRLVPISGR